MKRESSSQSEFQLINPNAAGIDIASQVHYAAVPKDRDNESVRKFGSFTQDLHEMAQWFKKCGIDTIAMESTGIYWIQPYLILEEYGFDMYLVNARHIKNVSGRKSDVQDCQWIQQLHTFGLLKRSFQPNELIRELRAYVRHRKNLTESYASQILLMQKAFEQMNIKLHNVLSDITGVSGMRIIEAILSGERDAKKLTELADDRVHASKEEIEKSLTGIWKKEYLFELKQAYELYKTFIEKIKACDKEIERVLSQLAQDKPTPENKSKRKRSGKNGFGFDATNLLKQITGSDLSKVYGISEITATEILSETGTDMSKWETEKHFTSWLNLAPNNRTSGGKSLKAKKIKKKNRAGQAFLMAASTLKKSDHWLGAFYRRIKAKNGAPIAVKATARKLAVIFYRMLKEGIEFNPLPIETYNQYFKERKLKYLKKQAFEFGLALVPHSVS